MKYGIRLVKDSGGVLYVSSTRSTSRPSFSDEITDTALFVQEDSAIRSLKQIRLDGGEPDGYTLDVVGISFSVESSTHVERPPEKSGWCIHRTTADDQYSYYVGTKNPSAYEQYRRFENLERVTIFASKQKAQERLEQLLVEAHDNLDAVVKQGGGVNTQYYLALANQWIHHLESAEIINLNKKETV